MADNWIDGLKDLTVELSKLGNIAKESIKEQIDIDVEEVYKYLVINTPINTGGLLRSLTKTKIDTPERYGYILKYEGENKNGVPYEKIANILNYGSIKLYPRYFKTKAIRKVKGLDDRIAIRYETKLKDLKGGGNNG